MNIFHYILILLIASLFGAASFDMPKRKDKIIIFTAAAILITLIILSAWH